MEKQQSDENLQFSLSVSTDREHFLRRTCPTCGRDFKTEIDKADLIWAIAPQIRRMGLEIGTNPDNQAEEVEEYLCCPYCKCRAEASTTLTEETVNYLHNQIMREFVLPQFHKAFSGLESSNREPKDFISIDIKYSRSLLPPRPIHGPEPPDMKIIEFLCCGKRAKVAEQWNEVASCVYCETSVILT